MREGTANRILYGDPTFRPFDNIQNRRPTLRVATDFTNNDGRVVVIIEDPASGEAWDPYHGPGRMERIVAKFDLPPGSAGVDKITFLGAVKPAGGDWILENRPGRAPLVWFTIYTKAPDDFQSRALWVRGAAHAFSVILTKTPGAPSGGISGRN